MINRRLVIIILVGVFVVVPLVLFGLYEAFWKGGSSSSQNPVVITDKDTGEQVVFDPNKAPDTDGTAGVTILGAQQLYDGVVPQQASFFQAQVGDYWAGVLKKQYQTLTIVPDGYNNDGNGTITGRLRLGQGNAFVSFVFTAKNTGETELVITDDSHKYGGNFDSGLTTFGAD
jgi:hypothetical protein